MGVWKAGREGMGPGYVYQRTEMFIKRILAII